MTDEDMYNAAMAYGEEAGIEKMVLWLAGMLGEVHSFMLNSNEDLKKINRDLIVSGDLPGNKKVTITVHIEEEE